jgi:hypothetical protein
MANVHKFSNNKLPKGLQIFEDQLAARILLIVAEFIPPVRGFSEGQMFRLQKRIEDEILHFTKGREGDQND